MKSWFPRSQAKAQTQAWQFKEFKVVWKKRSRYRLISIQMKPLSPLQVMTGVSTRWHEVETFLKIKEEWIRQNFEKFSEIESRFPQKKLSVTESYLFLGEELRLIYQVTPLKSAFFSRTDKELRLHLPEELYHNLQNEMTEQELAGFFPELHRFYKREAQMFLSQRLQLWAHEMSLNPQKLSFRNQRTRWGSCSSKGHLSLNWKLVACPLFVIDAILIHELAHLKHLNHSKEFWSLVEQYNPDYSLADQWLKQNQYALHFLNPD